MNAFYERPDDDRTWTVKFDLDRPLPVPVDARDFIMDAVPGLLMIDAHADAMAKMVLEVRAQTFSAAMLRGMSLATGVLSLVNKTNADAEGAEIHAAWITRDDWVDDV